MYENFFHYNGNKLIYHIAQNFGGRKLWSTHPDILAEKTLADGDKKSLLLVCTESIVVWLHGNGIYLNFSVESMIRGYHEYKVVWYNPLVGEDLLSERKVGNPHDMHTV